MFGFWARLKEDLKYEIGGIFTLALALFGLVSLYAEKWESSLITWQSIGPVGRFLARVLTGLAGEGRYLLPLFLIIIAVKLIKDRQYNGFSARMSGLFVLYLVGLTALHLPLVQDSLSTLEIARTGLGGQGGGLMGALFAVFLANIFGRVGTYIVLSAVGVVSILMIVNTSLSNIALKLSKILVSFGRRLVNELGRFLFTFVEEEDIAETDTLPLVIDRADTKKVPVSDAITLSQSADSPIVQVYTEEKEKPVAQKGKSNEAAQEFQQPKDTGESTQAVEFQLPPVTLLQRSLRLKNPRMNKNITEKVKLLEETLAHFGVKGKVTRVSCGPTITRYELQPAPGIKVSKIVSLADDIALSLASPDVRIEAPIPGKAAIGIEVPNKEVTVVHFREVLESPEFIQSSSKLTVALGMDIAGNPVVGDLSKMPHLLVAGSTGSGKSVCMNALLCSLLFKCKPSELKLIVIDPKMVELSTYNGIPHLISPVVTDPKKAATALRWMVNEMENRYELFAAAGVKDIERYNRHKAQENPESTDPGLPYIVVLIDELADLMMVAPADVEDAICRLAQMARAAGIHMVVATQRPSVDVITGLIKANIPSRIAFAVSSQTDSRTIIDMGGAEKLLGQGDMLFFPVGTPKPIRVQGVYVSDKEVDEIVKFLRNQGTPQYEKSILEAEKSTATQGEEQEDDLLPEAVRVLIESGQASISMLQRRLRIGYTRAARLIDIMEERGIVGGYEGSKPRAILIGWEEYEKMFGNL